MAKAVKLSDIAEKIGVSRVTVSKALSGQKGMSDELRERIVALADEMGYVKRVQNKEKENGGKENEKDEKICKCSDYGSNGWYALFNRMWL